MQALGSLSFAALLVVATCGGESATPGPPPADGSSADRSISVAGTERMGWSQNAEDASLYQYIAYVDDDSVALADAVCEGSGAAGFTCVAQLPQMSAGPHRIEIAANDRGAEGPKSSSFYVIVAMANAGVTARVASSAPRAITTADGARLTVETLAVGLDAPSALAATPDGRVFIAQGSGDVYVWQGNRVFPTPAATLADVQRVPGVGLVGMTLDNEFATNGRVYVAYAGRARNGAPVNRIVRFRELNNVFAEAAVIFEDSVDVVPARPLRIRMGRDRKLYVAFPAADWPTADGFASYAGKILRINDDGTTPRDNPNASPIISAGHAASGSFDWQPGSRLWLSERDRQGRDVLSYFSAAFEGTVAASFDSGVDASGAAFYPTNVLSAFANDLFIAGLSGQLLRVHFDPRDATRIESTETLIERQYGRFSDVVVGSDGAIYVSTSNRGLSSAAADDDLLLRLSLVAR